jgi:demethylmenaquinone methyltransferase / 2-methoxy-6-polyprenyl-1,4-benzoquinol methylase
MPLNSKDNNEHARQVQGMFARIAGRYDLMNRLMTGGQDLRWRREVIRRAELPASGRLLDLGAGTGDLAFESLRQKPDSRAVAADFTLQMMRVGQERGGQPGRLSWSGADALHLPFRSASFDAVVSGFLMRNVSDVPQALAEQVRVLKPGGRLVILDTTRPRKNLFTPLVSLHLRYIIPTLGWAITGERDAYRYLPESTRRFLAAEQLAVRMEQAGLEGVSFRVLIFGTTAIHWGARPSLTSEKE